MKTLLISTIRNFFSDFTVKKVLAILLGVAITSFGIYNIHQQTQITEGGVLGLILFLEHWCGIEPSQASLILDMCCYALAFCFLGGSFLKWSLFATLCLSGFFKLWEQFPPVLPDLSSFPLIAALLGGLFIGIGVGIVIRQGSSCGGDDALALTISHITHWRISRAYMITDLAVLLISLSYIPFQRIVFSLITVTVSSTLIDWVQNYGKYIETSNL